MGSLNRPYESLHTTLGNSNGEIEPGPMETQFMSAAKKAAIESWLDSVMAARKEYYQKALSSIASPDTSTVQDQLPGNGAQVQDYEHGDQGLKPEKPQALLPTAAAPTEQPRSTVPPLASVKNPDPRSPGLETVRGPFPQDRPFVLPYRPKQSMLPIRSKRN